MRSAVLLVACAVLGVTPPAAADDADDALELARQGEAAAASGDLAGAVTLFKRALALDPRPEYQCNVGVAYYKAGDQPRAQLFLSLCQARGSHLDATFLAGVRNVLVAVEDTLRAGAFTPIDVVVTPASAAFTVSAFAEDESVIGSRLVWLPHGDHTLTVSAHGHVTKTVPVTAAGSEPVRVPVTLDAEPEVPDVIDDGPPPPAERVPVTVRDERGGWRLAAIIGSVVTGVVAVGTAVQYAQARNAALEAGEQPPGAGYELARADAEDKIDQLYTMYGVTAGWAAVTAFLWYQAMPRTRTELRVAPADGGASVWLGGSF